VSAVGHGSSPDARTARILARVRAIPEGFVQTYGDIDPDSPRLVGHVLATTPEDVPWHRVVRTNGTAAMGPSQRDRLRGEGVPMRGDRVDMGRARWPGTLIEPPAKRGGGRFPRGHPA
jgi:methylated-DNA-protein-cysteine methyltransferase related protein